MSATVVESAPTPAPAPATNPTAAPVGTTKFLGLRKNGSPSDPYSISAFNALSEHLPADTPNAGKQWHEPKKAFRPTKGLTSYEQRAKARIAQAAAKAKERELKTEKEAERQVGFRGHFDTHMVQREEGYADRCRLQKRIQAIKERRAAKEEKERYEQLAAKMHKKRLERLKRKEKRNKLLNS
jgi:rRNA-processing protein CGR1